MTDPVAERAASSMADPPVRRFLEEFSHKESRSAYDSWMQHPVTRQIEAVLTEMALRPPVRPAETAVQYGMTVGLGMAALMLRSPETVFPSLFSGTPGQTRAPLETFDTSIDQI